MSKNILCTWCKLVLNSTDKVYSTSCGHIFHFNCMRSCQSRSTSCPECSCITPATHEVFLIFEKCKDENVATNWNEKLKIIELHKVIEENKTNFLHLQEKYSVLQDLVRKLEEKNRISNNGIIQRSAIISDLEDRINDLEEHNQFLTIDNECKEESLTLKTKQIGELKSLWLKKEKGAPSKESKTFESKFKNQSIELERELQCSDGETKLQKYINLSEWESEIKGPMTPNLRENLNTNVALKPKQNGPDKLCLSLYEKEDSSVTSISENAMDNSLIIKNFPKKDIIYPLKKVIPTFFATQQGYISEDDITDVYVKDGQGKSYFQLPTNITLFVQFNNRDLKHKFLLSRAQIQQTIPSLELIEINDDIKEMPKSYSDGESMQLNSRDNITEGNRAEIQQTIPSLELIEINDVKGMPKSYSDGETIKPNSRDNITTKLSCTEGLLLPYQNEPKNLSIPSISECSIPGNSLSGTHANDIINISTGNSLLIKNFPKKDLIYPLKNVILTFVATREGYISEDDITDVYIKDGHGKNYSQLPNYVTLFVQFTNRDLKLKFLLNRTQILQTSPTLELIEVNDGIKEASKSYTDSQTLKPNSKDNITTKLPSTEGLLTPDKLSLSRVTKENNSVPSISECSLSSDSLIPNDNINTSTGNSLFIKNFPKNDLEYPLKNVILKFVAHKEGAISEADITDVYVKDRNGKNYFQLPDYVTLFVQFTNVDLKLKFLLNRAQILQTSPTLELIEIDDDIKGASKSYSDGDTLKPNSKDNITTKLPCTEGLLTPDKFSLYRDTKENYAGPSISKCSITSDSLIRTHPNDNINSSNENSIFIKNFPKNELKYPLKNIILKFVATKEGYISENDITKVYVKDGFRKSFAQLPMKVTLFVQFKNQYLKQKFLLNRADIQKTLPSIEFIEIDQNNGGIKENINKKVPVTNAPIKSYQNAADAASITQCSKVNGSVTSPLANDKIQPTSGINILIKNVPKKDLIYPLKHYILTFVATREGYISEDDITKVHIKDGVGRNKSPEDSVTLFVQFKNEVLKRKFLVNRAHIQQASPSIKLIEMANPNYGIQEKDNCYNDGKTKIPNSKENNNKKVSVTNGSTKSYQNGPNKLSLSHDIDYYAIPTSECSIRTQPKDKVNSSTGNNLLKKDVPKNEPLKKELIETNNDDVKGTEKSVSDEMTTKLTDNVNTTVACTSDSSVRPSQNLPDKLSLSQDKKDEYSVIPITDFLRNSDNASQTQLKDNINSSTDNRLLTKDIPKNELKCPLNKELIQTNKCNDGIKGTDKSFNDGKPMKPNSRENINTQVGNTSVGSVKPYKNPFAKNTPTSTSKCSVGGSNSARRTNSNDKRKSSSSSGNSLLIKNVPKKDLIYPLKQFILTFVATREGCISEDDIIKANIKDGRGRNKSQLPIKVTLFVQFKNHDLKEKFLLNRAHIQQKSPSIELIEIDKQNDDDDTNEEDLLKYAIQKLSGKGFSFFFRQNDEVMALKNRSDSEGVKILNKAHVNDLLKSQKKN